VDIDSCSSEGILIWGCLDIIREMRGFGTSFSVVLCNGIDCVLFAELGFVFLKLKSSEVMTIIRPISPRGSFSRPSNCCFFCVLFHVIFFYYFLSTLVGFYCTLFRGINSKTTLNYACFGDELTFIDCFVRLFCVQVSPISNDHSYLANEHIQALSSAQNIAATPYNPPCDSCALEI
jgi:hypothetical protein